MLLVLATTVGGAANLAACSANSGDADCGPTHGTVAVVVDGDTVDLEGGERIRYLSIDTPELGSNDCWAAEAAKFNAQLVEGRSVRLTYDGDCTDRYGRLLAYVSVDERNVNALLVERGYACAFYLPPGGAERAEEFAALESTAREKALGMWGACTRVTCN